MQTPLDPVTLSHLRIRTTANAPGQTPESYGIAWDMVNTEQTVAISNRLNSPQSVLGRCINTPSPSSGRPPQAGRLQSNNSRCVMCAPPTHTQRKPGVSRQTLGRECGKGFGRDQEPQCRKVPEGVTLRLTSMGKQRVPR